MIVGNAFADQRERVQRDPDYQRLEQHLLTFGGHALVYRQETPEVIALLLTGGKCFPTTIVKRVPGLPSHCHSNVEQRARKRAGREQMATGYGLSSDGLWRQHSWLVRVSDGAIIETTVVRTAYYGIVLDADVQEIP